MIKDFIWALREIKSGRKVCREGWNGKVWIRYVGKDESVKMNGRYMKYPSKQENLLPFILMKTAQGDFILWLASQTDILAEDWEGEVEINE